MNTFKLTICCSIFSDSNKFQQTFFNDSAITNKIDFSAPISFLIHGYTDSFKRNNTGESWVIKSLSQHKISVSMHEMMPKSIISLGWMEPTALIWAKSQKTNVCTVDWHPLTAQYLNLFIRYLIRLGAELSKMVVAGHSLGILI